MKRLPFIGLLLLLAFSACHSPTHEAKRMVQRAERLADTLPDSTLRLIDSVLRMPVGFSERRRMDMALLQGEVLFRDAALDDDFSEVLERTATSPELERAANYYAKKKQYNKAAHAALYSGYVQQHYNDKAFAMQSFKDAEHYGGLVRDSLTMARAEFRIAKLLYEDYMEKEALSMLKTADLNFGIHFGERAFVQNLEAAAYIVLKQFDSAEMCLKYSLTYVEQSQSFKAKRKALNNYAVLYRLQGNYDQAISCLKHMADEPDLTSNEKTILYLNLGKTFSVQGEMDSAAVYYQRLDSILPFANAKNETVFSAYEALSRFAESQGNKDLILQYREFQEKLLYDVMKQQKDQAVYRIQQQYDYESLQNGMNKKIIQRHRIILIISILLFFTTIIILVLRYRQKQLLEAEKEMKREIDAMKQDLRQTVKPSVMDKEVALRLRMILTAKRTTKRANDPKNEWQPLVNHVMSGKETSFEAARTAIETVYPDLYQSVLEKHPNLTDTEAKVCLLSCSDLSNAEIAELLELSPNTVNQNRSNLRKKLNLNPDSMKEQLRSALSKEA